MPAAPPAAPPDVSLDAPRPVVEHLSDLRSCLFKAVVGCLAASALGYANFDRLLALLIRPPIEKLAFLSPMEPFFARIKLAFVAGLLISFPWLLYQAWVFAAPGLKARERSVCLRLIPAAYLLFLAGAAMGLFVAAPLGLKFLLSFSNQYLVPYVTLGAYLDYLAYLTLGMGALFQLPIVLFGMAMLGLMSSERLGRYRRHVLLGILVLVAVITPGPDLFGQILLAGPTYLLFELSIIAVRLCGR